ncbi:MAG: DUF2793 domain-containing protein, partial [Alphaproteobacteria bacterium]|nr:DUF2793 domain-containing protein [Alphaproteobacteria bacterium]
MSDITPNLALPYIMAAQAQKHVTHNEAIRALDAIVQLGVIRRDLGAAPVAGADGERYIVGPAPSGAWAGHEGDIAAWQDGGWRFYAPQQGWLAWVADEAKLYGWDGTAWILAGGGSVNPTPLVGINTAADVTNRLAVSSPASLFNHDGGGHQQKINKAAAGDTASVLFQAGFSGRAEMGLTGDDDYHFKVSADGVQWREAIVIDRATGMVDLPNTQRREGLTAARTYSSSTPIVVANLTKNVLIRSKGTNTGADTSFIRNLAQNATSFLLENVELAYLGANAAGKYGVTFDGSGVAGTISSSTFRQGYHGLYYNASSSHTLIGLVLYG